MVLTKRVIPCMDMKAGRVVKGVSFKDLRDAGDPIELASRYEEEGADEVVLLDVSASQEGRCTLLDVVRRTANVLFIPFTVGGGIKDVEDIRQLLTNGADKVTINTAAVEEPLLLRQASETFGSQCIVISIDVKRVYVRDMEAPGKVVVDTPEGKCWWDVYIFGGSKSVGIDAVQWAEMAAKLGAGEIVASSLDFDGRKQGYDNAFLRTVSERVEVPLIASSGAGNPKHMLDAITQGKADAVLAASIFHYGTYTIREVKKYLQEYNIPVRL
ncbi:imidazole glycerol phosphate synthase subunit HisF [Candidatus Bathyarchaeota archaeon]|nr:imidazole glycerol phosphate synthase subunit HisF [Candidatus Bathyarchaeota archaeon]